MSNFDNARQELLAAAASYIASEKHLDQSPPGPYDDAEMELRAEILDEAAFKYFVAKEGDRTRALRYESDDGKVVLVGVSWSEDAWVIPPSQIKFTVRGSDAEVTFWRAQDGGG